MHKKVIIICTLQIFTALPMKRTLSSISCQSIKTEENESKRFKKNNFPTKQGKGKRPNPYITDKNLPPRKKIKKIHSADQCKKFAHQIQNESQENFHSYTPGNMALAFIRAVMDENIEWMEALLKDGAFINAQVSLHGWSAIMIAVLQKKLDSTLWLMKNGANMYLKNTYGECAWDFGQYRQEILPILKQFQKQTAYNDLCDIFSKNMSIEA